MSILPSPQLWPPVFCPHGYPRKFCHLLRGERRSCLASNFVTDCSFILGLSSHRVPFSTCYLVFSVCAFSSYLISCLVISHIFLLLPLKVTLPLEPPIVVPERPLVFNVDGLLQRVTVRIHGEVSSFWIRNPAGSSMRVSRQRKNGDWRMRSSGILM